MAEQRLTYRINLLTDAGQTYKELEKVTRALHDISMGKVTPASGLVSDLEKAANAAGELESILRASTNVNTGKLDLSKFSLALEQSGKQLDWYQTQFTLLGQNGSQTFLNLAKAVSQAELPLTRTNTLVNSLWVTMKNTVRWQFTNAALRTFTGAISTARSYVQDLDESLNSIRIVTGQSADDMKEFAKQANQAAKELSTTTTNYTNASLIYFQQGLNADEVTERTNATIKMANVTGQTAETVSEQLTAIWNNFYDGSKSLEYYLDVMTALGANTASSSDEIAEGIQKFAAVANTVGLSYEYAAAALATLTANTREAPEVIGNSLKTLFARLQGLSLGETLDDDVDLNKYSKALAAIGVNILDVNGEIKAMDNLLNEIADKWDNLSNAQQTALAQTVAGVRQYSQFISLMESWGDFEVNLAIATGSEGTLQEQADIFEESWEAARKKVKASQEELYNELINEDFFIGFDKGLADFISGIAKAVKSLGGMGGVLNTVANIGMVAFGDKIAQGIRNMAYNIEVLRGREEERALALKSQFQQQLQFYAGDIGGALGNFADIYSNQIQAQIDINLKTRDFTEYQREQIDNEKRLLDLTVERAAAIAENTAKTEQQLEVAKQQVMAQANSAANRNFSELRKNYNHGRGGTATAGLVNKLKSNSWIAKGINIGGAFTRNQGNNNANKYDNMNPAVVEQLTNRYFELSQTLQQVRTYDKEYKDQLEQSKNGVEGAAQKAEQLKIKMQELGVSVYDTGANIKDLEAGYNILRDFLVDFLQVNENGVISVNELTQALGSQEAYLKILGNTTKQQAEQIKQTIEEIRNAPLDAAQSLVTAGQNLFTLVTAVNSVKSLANAFTTQEDVALSERFIRGLTGLAMILPVLSRLYSMLDKSLGLHIALEGEDAAIVSENTWVNKLYASQLAKTEVALRSESDAIKREMIVKRANNQIAGVSIGLLGLVTAGVVAATVAYNAYVEAQEKESEKRQERIEAAKATMEETSANKELVKQLAEALEIYRETGDNKDDVANATEALAEAYNVEGSALANLTGKYEDYNDVLEEALEKRQKELPKLIADTQSAIDDAVEEADYAARKGFSNYEDGFGSYLFNTKNFDLGNDDISQIIKNTLGEYVNFNYGTDTVINFSVPKDENGQSLLDYYNSLLEAKEQLTKSSNGRESDAFKVVTSEIERLKESIEPIKELRSNLIALQAEFGTLPGQTITAEQIKSYDQYKAWLEETRNILQGTYGDAEDVDKEIAKIVETSYNPVIKGFKDIYDAIIVIKKQITNDSDISEEFLEGILSNDDYDASIVASLNWAQITVNNFKDAYNAAKNYRDITNEITDESERLQDLQKSLQSVQKGGSSLGAEDYNQIYESIKWNEHYDKIEQFNQFLALTTQEQAELIQSSMLDIYQSSTTKLQEQIESARAQIQQQLDWVEENQEKLEEAAQVVDDKLVLQRFYNQYQSASTSDELTEKILTDEFWGDVAETGEKFSETFGSNVNWEEIFKSGSDFEEALEDATSDAEILVKAKANADTTITNLQNDIDANNLQLVINAKVNFENQLSAITDSVDGLVSIYNAIEKGVKQATDEAGNSVWSFSREAARAIESIYPGFMATADVLRDGTFALTQDMYQAFMDSSQGVLAADTQTKVSLLQNNIILLEAKRDQMEAALAIAERLASGEITLADLEYEDKKTLLEAFTAGKEIANGEMLEDEAKTLVASDSNWTSLWENVSKYSGEAAEDMATNVSNGTQSVLDNLEKIRDGAWAASQQISQIGVATKPYEFDKKATIWNVDTNSNSLLNGVKTNSPSNFIWSLAGLDMTDHALAREIPLSRDREEQKRQIEEMVSRLKDSNLSKRVGEALAEYYQSGIEGLNMEIGANKEGIAKLLEAINSAYDGLQGKQSSSKSSSKKAQTYTPEDRKTLDEILERYHLINREIQHQDDLLDDLSNKTERTYGVEKLKNYEKQLKALEGQQQNYNTKLKEAEGWLEKDKEALEEIFGDKVEYTATGEIANYWAMGEEALNNYNSFMDLYEAFQVTYAAAQATADEAALEELNQQKETWETRKKEQEDLLTKQMDAIQQYEDTKDVWQEVTDKIEENLREQADVRLSALEYHLEIYLDVKNLKDAIRDVQKEFQEMFGDALTHSVKTGLLSREQVEADIKAYKETRRNYEQLVEEYNKAGEEDRDRIMKDIQDRAQEMLDYTSAIQEWANTLEDLVPDALDAARERFEQFTDQLEHNQSILETIKELYALQGMTYKTQQGFDRLQKVAQEKLEAQVATSQAQHEWFDNARIGLEQAQAELDQFIMTNGGQQAAEQNPQYDYYKKQRDAMLEEFNAAQEAYLQAAQAAMETAREMYLEQIDKAVYDFGQKLSDGLGLDLLQDKYDHYIEKEERYLDKVNEAYETTAWYLKLQADIDNTDNAVTRDRLKALQEEIDLRREGGKLSQYDLDILNAKYNVLQAQAALEDAQNAKNKLQLVRDRQGNWNYQYTANPDDIADKEKDLIDAQNEWYNIAKKRVKDTTGEIVSAWKECQDKIKEVYQDMTLTDQERADRAEEIYNYYTDKIKYLEEEKQVAIKDMTQAGNESLFADAVIMGDKLTDLTGLTSEDIQQIVQDGGESIIGMLTADNETIANIVYQSAGLVDLFDNKYAEDLHNMTQNTAIFEEALQNTLGEAEGDFISFNDVIDTVAKNTGTTLGELDSNLEDISTSTDRIRDAAHAATAEIWNMVAAVQALAQEQINFMPDALDIRNEAVNTANDAANFNATANDYSAQILKYYDEHGHNFLDTYYGAREYIDQRAEKYDNENWAAKDVLTNSELFQVLSKAEQGDEGAIKYLEAIRKGWAYFTKGSAREFVDFFDTGGYTGDFADAKLAFLHQKELVLNQQDTENILSAVQTMRDLGPDLFASIEKAIDSNAVAAIALMGQHLVQSIIPDTSGTLEQNIHIDTIEFPNVTSADGLEEAFKSLPDRAAQWARRRI